MIRRTFCWPIFFLAVALVVSALGGFRALHGWQLGRLSKTLLVRAEVEAERKAWGPAADYLDHYLRLQPNDQAARVRLANVVAKGAETADQKQRAVALHYRALGTESGDQEDELRSELATLLLDVGRLIEAEQESQEILKKFPESPRAMRVYALARYFQWKGGLLSSKPLDELDLLGSVVAARELNPDDLVLAEVAATIYRDYPEVVKAHEATKHWTLPERQREADDIMNNTVRRNSKDSKAVLMRHLYRVRYSLRGAEDDLEDALRLAPDDNQMLFVAGDFHFRAAQQIRQSQPDNAEAESNLLKAKSLFGKLTEKADKDESENIPADAFLRLGDTLALLDAVDEAIGVWRNGLERYRQPTAQVAFHARIADRQLHARNPLAAKPSLDAVDKILLELGGTLSRHEHMALLQAQGLRRGRYALLSGHYSDAVVALQQAIARQPQLQPNAQVSYEAWDLLGRGYAGMEDWTSAATAFDRAANFQATAVAPRLAGAQAWLYCGRADLAIDRAEQAIAMKGPPEAWILLATGELQLQMTTPISQRKWQKLDEALKQLDQPGIAARIDAPWRIDFLRADFASLRSQTEDDPTEGKTAAAEALRLAESKYQDPAFWSQVSLAYERLGFPDEAERAWQRLNRIPGAATEATIVAVRRAALHQDYAAAERLVEEARNVASAEVQPLLRRELLLIAQARQDLPEMRTLLEAELRERPADVGILCKLAELDQRDEKWEAVQGWEKRLEEAGSLGDLWSRYFRIVRLYSSAKNASDLDRALAEQAQLATLRPNWAESYALRGAIEQRRGALEAAVAAYKQAIDLGESRYAVFEQLIGCLEALGGQEREIDKYVARLESFLPATQRLTELASSHRMREDNPAQAVAIAKRAVAQRPRDMRARLWLGRLLLATGQLTEAESIFVQATKDAPQDVRVWNGLFAYCVRIGDKKRARQVLQSLGEQVQLDPIERDFAKGQALIRLGDGEEAITLFSSLVERAPRRADVHYELGRLLFDQDREAAKHHLQQATEIDPTFDQARWLLATILAASGTSDDLAEAERLLSASGQRAMATVEDRRVRAVLLAQHGGAAGLARAIQVVEQMIQEGSASANDRLLLAQFYERQAASTTDQTQAASRLSAARSQLLDLANRPTAQPAEIIIAVGFLLRQGETNAAGELLDRLETRLLNQSQSDHAAVAQLIELRIQHGSVAQCEKWVERLERSDPDRLRSLAARVTFLHAGGQREAVEPLLEKKAKELLEATAEQKERTHIARVVGDLFSTLNNLPGAERWYRVVIKEDREQFQSLALTLMRQGKAREAIAICKAAGEYDQSSRPAVVLTSILLETGGKAEYIELAEASLETAFKRFPDDVALLYGMGMLRILQDRYADAIVLLEKVVRLAPRHVPALNNLACILAESPDRRAEALEMIERAIELKGQEPTLLDTRGTILVGTGDAENAVPLLEAASRGTSADPRHQFHLALAYGDVGSEDKARTEFKSALERDLEKQILTPTDRKHIERLKSTLSLNAP